MSDVTQEQVVEYIKGISVLELSQLVKTLEEELGVEVEVGAFVARGSAVIPGTSAREIILDVYRGTLVDGPRQAIPREHAELAWVAPEDFGRYSFPEADMPAVDALAAASK